MQVKRVVLSLVLLLTYSVGFAHYLIPHCHEGEEAHVGHHHHEHHHHDHDEHHSHEDAQHIHHNDHVDANVYDLLACLVSEMEHPAEDCGLEHFEFIENYRGQKELDWNLLLLSTVYVQLTFPELTHSPAPVFAERAIWYAAPPLINCPLRGPPVLS